MASKQHIVEFSVKAGFDLADEGVLALNEKLSQLQTGLYAVPAVRNVEMSDIKVLREDDKGGFKDVTPDDVADRFGNINPDEEGGEAAKAESERPK